MTIRDEYGDLLKAPVEAIVNTVNTVGVMGKGIALQFKRAYPEMFKVYAQACKDDQVRLGEMWLWPTSALEGPRLIVNFPTKGHWRANSKLDDVRAGLVDLVRVVREHGIRSIAVPPLGCGNGGLRWSDVRPLIEEAFAGLDDVEVCVFPPKGAPAAASMTTATPRPRMTRGKAALVVLLSRYAERSLEVSVLEAQKLMYFLQTAGEELNLRYEKGRYGPYADNLSKVLVAVEGHFLTGYGDGSQPVQLCEPLLVHDGALAEAEAVVAEFPALAANIERVLDLVDGFESAYSLELLATVHWVGEHDDEAKHDSASAGALVRSWNERKAGLFGQAHVELAWNRLRDQGWLGLPALVDA